MSTYLSVHHALTTNTAAAEDPVTLDEAKLHLRVDSDITTDDGLIVGLIKAATRAVEREIGQALVTRTLLASYDAFPWVGRNYISHREAFLLAGGRSGEFLLPYPPLQSVSSITYTDTAGASQTLNTSTYQVDTESMPGRVVPAYGTFWPVSRLETPNAVQILYVAGWGAPDAVPEDIRSAILMTIGHWWMNRESVITGTIATEVPQAAKWLLEGNWTGAYC